MLVVFLTRWIEQHSNHPETKDLKAFFSMANKRDLFASLAVIQMPDVAQFTDR